MIKPTRWTRYAIKDHVAPGEGFRDLFVEAIQAHAFVSHASPEDASTAVGWCHANDLLATDFSDPGDWSFGPYIVLGLRMDRRKVPAALLRASIAAALRDWCARNDRDRCPSAVKTEIKEGVTRGLLRTTIPHASVVPVAWNIQDGTVILGTHAEGDIGLCRLLFKNTFGHLPFEIMPVDGLDEEAAEALGTLGYASELAAEFLAWAWSRAQMGHGSITLNADGDTCEWWIDDRVGLAPERELRPQTTVKGDRVSESATLLGAFAEGEKVRTARLGLRRSDREYTVTLATEALRIGSAKMPRSSAGDRVEDLHLRMFGVEEVHAILDAMFAAFAADRISDRWGQHAGSVATYMGQWAAAKFDIAEDGQVRLFSTPAAEPAKAKKGKSRG